MNRRCGRRTSSVSAVGGRSSDADLRPEVHSAQFGYQLRFFCIPACSGHPSSCVAVHCTVMCRVRCWLAWRSLDGWLSGCKVNARKVDVMCILLTAILLRQTFSHAPAGMNYLTLVPSRSRQACSLLLDVVVGMKMTILFPTSTDGASRRPSLFEEQRNNTPPLSDEYLACARSVFGLPESAISQLLGEASGLQFLEVEMPVYLEWPQRYSSQQLLKEHTWHSLKTLVLHSFVLNLESLQSVLERHTSLLQTLVLDQTSIVPENEWS